MSNTTVSAVIAVYNPNLDYFSKAIDSVLNQKFPVLELILVNDGGRDEFMRVLPEDPRIRIFTKSNEGVAATRNFAIAQCLGRYIAFLDQDDFWYPDKLQEQLDMIPVEGDICMVISPVDIVDNKNNILKDKHAEKSASEYRRKTENSDFLLHLFDGNCIYSSAPLVHRDVFDSVGYFDSYVKPHDDWDMYLRIAYHSVPIYIYRACSLSVWRLHDSNESHKKVAMLRSKCRVEKKLIKIVNDRKCLAILHANLLIDYIDRDQFLYKKGRYRCYRSLLRKHFEELTKYCYSYRNEISILSGKMKRIRKEVIKASRRYIVSYFMRKKS